MQYQAPDEPNAILTKAKLRDLVNQVSTQERLEPGVEDLLVEIAQDFLESVTNYSCSLARHRQSDTLQAKDVALPLQRLWNIKIPGYGNDLEEKFQTSKKSSSHKDPEKHQERMKAIKKASGKKRKRTQ